MGEKFDLFGLKRKRREQEQKEIDSILKEFGNKPMRISGVPKPVVHEEQIAVHEKSAEDICSEVDDLLAKIKQTQSEIKYHLNQLEAQNVSIDPALLYGIMTKARDNQKQREEEEKQQQLKNKVISFKDIHRFEKYPADYGKPEREAMIEAEARDID